MAAQLTILGSQATVETHGKVTWFFQLQSDAVQFASDNAIQKQFAPFLINSGFERSPDSGGMVMMEIYKSDGTLYRQDNNAKKKNDINGHIALHIYGSDDIDEGPTSSSLGGGTQNDDPANHDHILNLGPTNFGAGAYVEITMAGRVAGSAMRVMCSRDPELFDGGVNVYGEGTGQILVRVPIQVVTL